MASLYPNGIKGLSDSKWSGVPGSASKLVGIDLHSTPGLIKVHQKLTKNSGSTVTELCKHKIGASNGTTLWFSSESGKIWREVSGTWTLVHTTVPTSGGSACLGAAEFEHWILWATESYLHRIHIDDINATWSNHVYQNWQAFSIGDDEAHPMAEQNLELFIGDKEVIAKVTDASTAAPNPTESLATTLGSSVKWLAIKGLLNPSEDAFPTLLASERYADSYPEVGITADVTILAVGGGGGSGGVGGASQAGGGGGGGQVSEAAYNLVQGSYAVTVGAGGAGSVGAGQGANGASSVVAGVITVVGGGGGGGNGAVNGLSGASGGGAANGGTGGAATAGYAGGSSSGGGSLGASGGGGAGAVGSSNALSVGGAGGAGVSSSVSGTPTSYGGGGGGSSLTGAGGAGGTGGGGAGGLNGAGVAGTANTGGGGGGSSYSGSATNGAAGGSGVVIISYPTGSLIATGGTITTAGGNTIHTFTTNGTFVAYVPKDTVTQSLTIPPGTSKVLFAVATNYMDENETEIASSATFNGVAMTSVASGAYSPAGGPDISYNVFRLLNPDAITANVEVNWDNPVINTVVHYFVFDLVDQAAPTTGFGAETGSSTSATSTLDSTASYQTRLAFVISQTATHTPAAGQTAIEAGTNAIGNDSSSYVGTTANYGFTAETLFNLKEPERITTLEPFDVDLLVGTRRPNRNKASVKRWDTTSTSWSAEDVIDESSINAFLRDENYVYVQAGDFGRFYFYNGEQLLPYQRIPGEWSPTKTGKVHPSAVAFLLGVPVFGLSNVTGNPALQGVYSFGSYSKDYAKVLDLSFPISSGNLASLDIGAVLVKGADLYVAWKDATSAGVDKLDYTAKYASAYIETMMLSGANERGVLKTSLEACAYYASLPANTGITFGYKKNYEANYTTIDAAKTLNNTKLSAIEARETIPEVSNLQLRFGFTVSSNNAPEVEDFDSDLAPLKK